MLKFSRTTRRKKIRLLEAGYKTPKIMSDEGNKKLKRGIAQLGIGTALFTGGNILANIGMARYLNSIPSPKIPRSPLKVAEAGDGKILSMLGGTVMAFTGLGIAGIGAKNIGVGTAKKIEARRYKKSGKYFKPGIIGGKWKHYSDINI